MAEMVKLSENAYRDVNIAFANELSLLCDDLETDVWEVIRLANRHPRVHILRPGPGVGGHCIAVDPWFLVDSAPLSARLIRTAREVNNSKPDIVLRKILDMASAFREPSIACLGLAFKPDIDDLRESPALHIVERLAAHDTVNLLVCEPYRRALPDSLANNRRVRKVDLQESLELADVVVPLVAHRSFCLLDPAPLRGKLILDVCGIWEGCRMETMS
jgi:UDP-N-acetyl-D-mannosaminuronic acid dehydrogenase